jgi:hypothetical protein
VGAANRDVAQPAAQPGVAAGDQQLRILLTANPDESLRDLQDYKLLLLGFAFAGRASDLVSLDVGDIEFTDRGLLVHLRESKTDQETAGEVIAVPTGQQQETDPILASSAGYPSLSSPLARSGAGSIGGATFPPNGSPPEG